MLDPKSNALPLGDTLINFVCFQFMFNFLGLNFVSFLYYFTIFFIFIFIFGILIIDLLFSTNSIITSLTLNTSFGLLLISKWSIFLLCLYHIYFIIDQFDVFLWYSFDPSELLILNVINKPFNLLLLLGNIVWFDLVCLYSLICFYFYLLFFEVFFMCKTKPSFIILSFVALFSGILILYSTNFLILYLSFEISAICVYILASSQIKSPKAIESGIKYLILAALSSGIFLLGVVCLYFITGSLDFSSISFLISEIDSKNFFFIFSVFLISCGFLFKLGLFPFHTWVIDVYEGAALPFVSLMATVLKIFYFSGFVKFIYMLSFSTILNKFFFDFFFLSISCISIIIGTLGALNQYKIKRFLAYSGISHLGYIFLFLFSSSISLSFFSVVGSFFYLFIYLLLSLLIFGVLIICSPLKNFQKENMYFFEFSYWNPSLRFFVIFLILGFLSMGGLPPLAGFFSKFFLLKSLLENSHIFLVFFVFFFSSISIYYYLRFISFSFFSPLLSKFSSLQFWFFFTNSKYFMLTLFLSYLFIFNLFFFFDIFSFYFVLCGSFYNISDYLNIFDILDNFPRRKGVFYFINMLLYLLL